MASLPTDMPSDQVSPPWTGEAVSEDSGDLSPEAYDVRLTEACQAGDSSAIAQMVNAHPDRVRRVWGQLNWQCQGPALRALTAHWQPTPEEALDQLNGNSMDEIHASVLWPDLVTLPEGKRWLTALVPYLIEHEFASLAHQIQARLRADDLKSRPDRPSPRPRHRA